MFKPILTCLFLLCAAPLAAAGPAVGKAWTLQAVLDEARAKAPAVQAARAEADAALDGSWAAFAWPDPQLGFEWMQLKWPGPELGAAPETRLSLTQELPFPGRTLLEGMATRAQAQAQAARAAVMEAEALGMAEEAWWRLQESLLRLKGLDEGVEAMQKLKGVSERRARFGKLDRMGQLMDAMLAREQGRLLVMRLEARRAQRQALADLYAALGKEWADEPAAQAALVDPEALEQGSGDAKLAAQARKASPQLKAAEAEDLAAGRMFSSAATAWLPDLMLEGGVSKMGTGMGTVMESADVKVGLTLPLWFWGKTAKAVAAKDMQAAAGQRLRQTRLDVEAKVKELEGRLRNARESVGVLRRQAVVPAQKALELGVAAFSSGDVSASEAMNAVMGYVQLNDELAMQAGQVGMARAALRRLAGPSEDSHE